jgi:hypothetical protein
MNSLLNFVCKADELVLVNISYPGEDGVAFEIQKQSTKQNFSLQTKDQIKKSTGNFNTTFSHHFIHSQTCL